MPYTVWMYFVPGAAVSILRRRLRIWAIDGPLVTLEGKTVCGLQELQAIENLFGMAQEEFEQRELNRCQGKLAFTDECRVTADVEDKILATEQGILLCAARLLLRAPQDGFHTSSEFAHTEGLDEVIVSAKFESEQLVDLVVAGRQHEDREL